MNFRKGLDVKYLYHVIFNTKCIFTSIKTNLQLFYNLSFYYYISIFEFFIISFFVYMDFFNFHEFSFERVFMLSYNNL